MKKLYLLLSILTVLVFNISNVEAQESKKKNKKFEINVINYFSLDNDTYYIGALNLGYTIIDDISIYVEGAISENIKIDSKEENTKYLLMGLELDQKIKCARFVPSFGFGVANVLNEKRFTKRQEVMFIGLKFINDLKKHFYWGTKIMYIRHDRENSLFNFGFVLGFKF